VVLEKDGDQFDRLVRNEEVLQRQGEEEYLHIIKRTKAKWIGHILRRNFLLQHVIEINKERTKRRERRGKQLLDDLMEKRRQRK
jgi:hypothetical protein